MFNFFSSVNARLKLCKFNLIEDKQNPLLNVKIDIKINNRVI